MFKCSELASNKKNHYLNAKKNNFSIVHASMYSTKTVFEIPIKLRQNHKNFKGYHFIKYKHAQPLDLKNFHFCSRKILPNEYYNVVL